MKHLNLGLALVAAQVVLAAQKPEERDEARPLGEPEPKPYIIRAQPVYDKSVFLKEPKPHLRQQLPRTSYKAKRRRKKK